MRIDNVEDGYQGSINKRKEVSTSNFDKVFNDLIQAYDRYLEATKEYEKMEQSQITAIKNEIIYGDIENVSADDILAIIDYAETLEKRLENLEQTLRY